MRRRLTLGELAASRLALAFMQAQHRIQGQLRLGSRAGILLVNKMRVKEILNSMSKRKIIFDDSDLEEGHAYSI